MRRPPHRLRLPIAVGCLAAVLALSFASAAEVPNLGPRVKVRLVLDVKTKFGRVRNEMTASGEPTDDAAKVEVHATTSFGDIVVRRA